MDIPEFNYWRWQPGEDHFDWDLDGRINRGELDPYDLRSDDFELKDLATRNRFWTAEQAANYYFNRDPEKVDLREVGFEDDPTDESSELRHQILRLRAIIEDQQAQRNLPKPAIDRDRFFEWAAACGIDCSHLRNRLNPPYNRAEKDNSIIEEVQTEKQSVSRPSDVNRMKATLLRIILGLIGDRSESETVTAAKITKVLEKLQDDYADKDLTQGKSRYAFYVKEARDLIR